MSKFDPPGRRPKRTDREELKRDVVRGLMGGLPLTVVARRHGTSQTSVDRWAAGDPSYADEIAAARALGWDSLAVECLEIIDDKDGDVMHDADGTARANTANVLRDKARVETRLRLLACWDNGRYGPARTVKVEGEITATTRHVIDPATLDEVQRAALLSLLAHAEAQGLIAGPEPEEAEYEVIEEDEASGT
jgi:hypothetical protein